MIMQMILKRLRYLDCNSMTLSTNWGFVDRLDVTVDENARIELSLSGDAIAKGYLSESDELLFDGEYDWCDERFFVEDELSKFGSGVLKCAERVLKRGSSDYVYSRS